MTFWRLGAEPRTRIGMVIMRPALAVESMASTGENCAVNIGSLVSARRFRCERPAGLNAAGDPTRLLRLSEVTSLCVPPAFVHRITKYDPADPDEHGSYRGAEEAVSDHEPVEAGYLEAISAFAEAAGIDRLEIREPSVAGFVHLGAQPAVEGHGLSGLFPADLTGYHEWAEVSLAVALELIRVMLREQGDRCRLEAVDLFRRARRMGPVRVRRQRPALHRRRGPYARTRPLRGTAAGLPRRGTRGDRSRRRRLLGVGAHRAGGATRLALEETAGTNTTR